MRRAGFAFLLTLFVPILLCSQRRGAEGTSGSIGSSSSPAGSTYSGGNASASSSSNSHSSGSPAGNAGGSAGSSASDHSSGSNPGISEAGARGHGAGGSSSSNSPHRVSDNSSEQRSSGSARPNVQVRNYSEPLQHTFTASQSGSEYPLEPLRFSISSTGVSDAKRALREGRLDLELRQLGLEPSQASYRQRLASLAESSSDRATAKPNWFARAFLGRKPREADLNANPDFRPCVLKECKPFPNPPPRPKPPKPPAQQATACTNGIILNSGECVPWGYVDHCSRHQCYARLRRVDSSYCDDLYSQLEGAQQVAKRLKNIRINTCALGGQSQACVLSTREHQAALKDVQRLWGQYDMCLRATSDYDFIEFDMAGIGHY